VNELLNRWLDYASNHPHYAMAITISVQLTVIVGCGGIAAKLLRQRSASARHLVWASVVAASILLIPARLWVPSPTFGIAAPRGLLVSKSHVTSPLGSQTTSINAAPFDQTPSQCDPQSWAWSSPDAAKAIELGLQRAFLEPVDSLDRTEPDPAAAPQPAQANVRVTSWALDMSALPAVVYLAGVFLCLCHALIGWRRLSRMTRNGSRLSGPAGVVARQCAQALGMRQPPECVLVSGITIPMTWSLLRPNVLLPADFESLDESSQRNCLLHEMAHIVRRDSLWNWISILATSIYWFHPAIHLATRKLKQVREDATDDRVLLTGVDSPGYAATLLELTTRITAAAPRSAVAMASMLPIESRLRRILDRSAPRRIPSNLFRGAVIATFALLTAIGFRFTTVAAQPPAQDKRGENAVATPAMTTSDESATGALLGATYFERMKRATLAQGDPGGVRFTVGGKVVDSDGDPVAGAMVVLSESSTQRRSSQTVDHPIGSPGNLLVDDVFARTITDIDGGYRFSDVAAPQVGKRFRDRWHWNVIASNVDGDLGWGQLSRGYAGPAALSMERDIKLRKSSPVAGQLLSAAGVPAAGVLVRLGSLARPNPVAVYLDSPDRLDLGFSSLQPAVVTGPDGRFTFPAMPSVLAAQLVLIHGDHSFPGRRITTNETESVDSDPTRPGFTSPLVISPATIEAEPRLMVKGVLKDESGSPLPGVRVRLASFSGYAETDQRGEFSWPTTEALMQRFSKNGDDSETVGFSAPIPDSEYVPGYEYVPLEQILRGQRVELTARRGAIVVGRVVSIPSGTPVSGVMVALHPAGDPSTSHLQLASTDELGAFRMVAPKQPVRIGISGPVPGFSLPDRGWPFKENSLGEYVKQVDLSDTSPQELIFEVDEVDGRQVRVVDGDGKPVEAAVVTATHMAPRSTAPERGTERELAGATRTDAEGYCTLFPSVKTWQNGDARATATIDAVTWFGSKSFSSDSEDPVVITLKKPWHLTGRVTVGGKPVANVPLRLSRRINANTSSSRFSMSRSRHHAAATTNAAGEYEFWAAPGEQYSVMVVRSPVDGKTVPRGYFPQLRGDGEMRFPDIDFPPQGTSNPDSVDAGAPAQGKISGSIHDLRGRPIRDARIQFYQSVDRPRNPLVVNPTDRPSSESDANGHFELTGLQPGRARFHVYPPRGEDAPHFVATYIVADVGADDVEIVVDPRLVAELPRVEAKRIVTAASVPAGDR
jgi:beta-lactamase regulating signal transducer with metallopeptidase domain/protocatechuate 3,4-dioxygenase beta subunit